MERRLAITARTIWIPTVTMLVVAPLCVATAAATPVNISTTYDGLPVTDSLPDHGYAVATAFRAGFGRQVVYDGQLNAGSVSFDLDPGTYNISLIVDTAPLAGRANRQPGDLYGVEIGVTVPGSGTVDLEFDMFWVVHVTSPVDNGSPWDGTVISCPYGPAVPSTFTLAWDPVPNATSYRVHLTRRVCGAIVESSSETTTGTSIEVEIDRDVAPNLEFEILADSSGGHQLARSPRMLYDDAASDFMLVHADGNDRPIGSTLSQVALQVARVQGVGSSFWTSDLTLSNPSSAAVTAEVVFTPRGVDGSSDYLVDTVAVPAGGTRTLHDVVGTTFGRSSAAGSLEVRSRTLQAWVRTSTPGGSGSFGQGFPMVTPDGPWVATADGESVLSAGGVERGGARTNLAVAELWGRDATIEVRLFDRNGIELGATVVALRPFENRQLNDVVGTLTTSSGDLAEGRVVVEVVAGAGRVAAALSIVDNGTDDPTTVMLQAP